VGGACRSAAAVRNFRAAEMYWSNQKLSGRSDVMYAARFLTQLNAVPPQ
jgi:hypothetical protein